jgi:hypothetical protein
MTMLLQELFNRLSVESEFDIIELLQINSEQLVEKFKDEIEEKYDELIKEYEEFNPFDNDEDLNDC